jgi:hypothetical protein
MIGGDRTGFPLSARVLFSVAVLARLLAVAVTTMTNFNPYATYDADWFARSAAEHAAIILGGQVPVVNTADIYDVWGLLLSPFWLLPGPSRLYARLGSALLGAVAVYNVYVVARQLHSEKAGIVAALPLALYPSVLFVHSTVLREAVVLVGITTAARLLIAPPPAVRDWIRYGAVAASLAVATVLRFENLPVYVLAIVIGVVVARREWFATTVTKALAALAAVVTLLVTYQKIQPVINRLAALRRFRARGQTEYLPDVIPETIPSVIAFSWVGVAYFLYAPFPWMVTEPALLVLALESVVSLVVTVFAISGVRDAAHRWPAVTAGLVVGFLVSVTLYGIATANVGAAARHRQMFTWVLFAFGGVGIARTVSDVVVRRERSTQSSERRIG